MSGCFRTESMTYCNSSIINPNARQADGVLKCNWTSPFLCMHWSSSFKWSLRVTSLSSVWVFSYTISSLDHEITYALSQWSMGFALQDPSPTPPPPMSTDPPKFHPFQSSGGPGWIWNVCMLVSEPVPLQMLNGWRMHALADKNSKGLMLTMSDHWETYLFSSLCPNYMHPTDCWWCCGENQDPSSWLSLPSCFVWTRFAQFPPHMYMLSLSWHAWNIDIGIDTCDFSCAVSALQNPYPVLELVSR